MKCFLTLLIVFCELVTYAQSGWLPWEPLYKDGQIEVEVSFKLFKNSCADGGRYSQIKYRVTGEIRSYRYFLNWKMDYVNCEGLLYYQINSLNIGSESKLMENQLDQFVYYPSETDFTCSSLENHFYEVQTASTESYGSGIKAYSFSKDPTGIEGNLEIQIGDSTMLSVKGGALGVDAQWVWYANSCDGSPIGYGENLNIQPNQTTTYFVRAETEKQKTNYSTATVTVNQLSIAPEYIDGVSKICKGELAIMEVIGGQLGLNAEWIWFTGSCGGTEIGRGKSIIVSPSENTTYYVRASGKLNNTTCVQNLISVYEKSVSASSITSSKVQCANEQITLSKIGGTLSSDARWVWYKESCGAGLSIGTGNTILVIPMKTMNYYVRAEGECNTTECAKIEIVPDQISIAPEYILPEKLQHGKQKLQIYHATLGKDADWKWYKDECGKGRVIGKGPSLIVKQYKPQVYFVRAEGLCNTTDCSSYEVIKKEIKYEKYMRKQVGVKTKNSHSFGPTYAHYNKKGNDYNHSFLHIGLGIGYDNIILSAQFNTTKFSLNNKVMGIGTETMMIYGGGIKGEFVLHPIMKDYLSLGIVASGAFGSYFGVSYPHFPPKGFSYYSRVELGAEFAVGFRNIKALLLYKSSIQDYVFKGYKSYKNYKNAYVFNKVMRKEFISIGTRLAPYSTRKVHYSRGFCIDLLLNLSHDYNWNWKSINLSEKPVTQWKGGLGAAIWVQSVLKLQMDYQFGRNTSIDMNYPYLQFSLIYNRNLFY